MLRPTISAYCGIGSDPKTIHYLLGKTKLLNLVLYQMGGGISQLWHLCPLPTTMHNIVKKQNEWNQQFKIDFKLRDLYTVTHKK